ncbi:uncharacterized protein TM35_000531360 [Trypanosoma theileri]|uniref:Uncharacterized protein n=1 Tax=Trypanosoma theileri TaxID=67003 RepID=A0A1X0NGS5_9TRYP|nr:uncharacterized protein TM35_000531360 [Trypanosoma theileri]ORC83952.1 hypothetical protein TM35_000531360 [Trypanosoma theileri]
MVGVLSVACVVAGEAQQEAELAEVSQMNSHTAGDAGVVPAGDSDDDDTCKAESTGPECSRIPSEPAVPRGECVGSTEKKGCTTITLKPKESCGKDTETCVSKETQVADSDKANENHLKPEQEHKDPNDAIGSANPRGSNSNLAREDRAEARPAGAHGEQNLRDAKPGKLPHAAASPAAGSPAVPVSGPGMESGDKSSTNESTAKAEGTEAQPSSSLTNSDTERDGGDNGANNGSDSTSTQEGLENTDTSTTTTTTTTPTSSTSTSTSGPGTQENNTSQDQTPTTEDSQSNNNTSETNKSENTNSDNANTPNNEESTITTTTTTLPPELTNNKKGDADSSSSSISSSVWVRVPLLIVVTLACILVC